MSMHFCTEVTPTCPVSASPYGYRPNLAGNAFFCAVFGLLCIIQIGLGIRYKTWTYMVALIIGTGMEFAGYIGRILMNKNPFNQSGFKLQIVMLILAPSLMSASIDLTLKHIVLVFGRERSRVRPALYTWFFIGLDFFSIIMQAIGGALAASGEENQNLLDIGNNVMMAGIAIQVAQLVLFAAVSVEYIARTYNHRRSITFSQQAKDYLSDWKFRCFCGAVVVAYFTILIRCVYRLPEMAAGWGNGLQRVEPAFLVLDGGMVAIAALILTIFHPGYCFPQLAKTSIKSSLDELSPDQDRQHDQEKAAKNIIDSERSSVDGPNAQ